MNDDSDDGVPELVCTESKKIPITIITGYLGGQHVFYAFEFFILF